MTKFNWHKAQYKYPVVKKKILNFSIYYGDYHPSFKLLLLNCFIKLFFCF